MITSRRSCERTNKEQWLASLWVKKLCVHCNLLENAAEAFLVKAIVKQAIKDGCGIGLKKAAGGGICRCCRDYCLETSVLSDVVWEIIEKVGPVWRTDVSSQTGLSKESCQTPDGSTSPRLNLSVLFNEYQWVSKESSRQKAISIDNRECAIQLRGMSPVRIPRIFFIARP